MPAISRRKALSGAAATAAAATTLANSAVALAADPVFAAIDRVRAAHAALERTMKQSSAIESEWFAIRHRYPVGVEVSPGVTLSSIEQAKDYFAKIHPARAHDLTLRLQEAMERAGIPTREQPAGPSEADLAAWRTEARETMARIADQIEAHDAARASIGLTDAMAADQAASDALSDAEAEAFGTVPTTQAGALALLAFVHQWATSVEVYSAEAGTAVANVIACLSEGGAHV